MLKSKPFVVLAKVKVVVAKLEESRNSTLLDTSGSHLLACI